MSTPVFFNQFKLKQNNGAPIDLDSATIKVMVVTSAYTPNQAHATKADITNEVTGTNYVARGTQIAGVTLRARLEHRPVGPQRHHLAAVGRRRLRQWPDLHLVRGHRGRRDVEADHVHAGGADFGNVNGDLILDGSAVTGVANFT
jgi:hypothetical protein